jgi:hypothetical protein
MNCSGVERTAAGRIKSSQERPPLNRTAATAATLLFSVFLDSGSLCDWFLCPYPTQAPASHMHEGRICNGSGTLVLTHKGTLVQS